ncbi:MAG: 3-phosphoshikimate 1-carboxyvinyltransferase [Bacteroidales bacterium]|jgi:3-phosphoshikimate 1-carboxyvinyltransferase|nr:3-phosphoshikimate 1-carboxyvinyltransferase [Bacteroidales bacterium]MCI2133665.1 3-phosphoshikimate 1-carboxyvinyltransferase [Bacteroidales bacterium]
MICVSIQHHGLQDIQCLLESSNPAIQMAEIRLDRCDLSSDDIASLFMADTPLVATCRVAGDGSGTWEEAEEKLAAAIKNGAAFVDVEIEAPKEMGKRLRKLCNEYGTTMIRSCHFFDGTPDSEELTITLEKCKRYGGEIAKIVAKANSKEDSERLMSLYNWVGPGELIAFAMGANGRDSRMSCLRYGAPFTYAALSENEAAAEGQWAYSEMLSALYGSRKSFGYTSEDLPLAMPASKSFAQRAIIAAALAEGTSHINGYSPCGDSEAALNVAQNIGATVERNGNKLSIKGLGGYDRQVEGSISVNESGLLTRLMIPISAAIFDGNVEINGAGTLLKRPLKGAAEIMAPFGVLLSPLSGAKGDLKVPLAVKGSLLPGKADISGIDGSQLISGLLMALPLCKADSEVHVRDPKSIPYMFITLDVLKKFGIHISSEMEGDEEFAETKDWAHCTGITFKIKGGQRYKAADFSIEGDWSAAANFLVAGVLFGKASLSGLDMHSLQADISIIDILTEAGARLSETEEREPDEGQETTAVLTVQKTPLRAFGTDLNNCPDLFPIVAILAALCNGRSTIFGFKRLASKESDRGEAILKTLSKMGVEAESFGDRMTISGYSLEYRLTNDCLLQGGKYSSFHDHRMAMALKVASLAADSPIEIDDTDCIAKSFPAFLETWKQAQ